MLWLKRNKTGYYLKNYIRYYTPKYFYKKRLNQLLSAFKQRTDQEYIWKRVNYYNKIVDAFLLDKSAENIAKFYHTKHKSTYFFDTWEHLRLFDIAQRFAYAFGDVTYVPKQASFVKSRPIGDDNAHSVVLKLDKIRHYLFVNDQKSFTEKKNMLVWRGDTRSKPNRIAFLKKYWNHPLCDVGQTHKKKEGVPWEKDRMGIEAQLEYKFILSLEGMDVATNLKWGMSSNSLVFSPKLKYETWFMEGQLIGNKHFVQIKDDYSDLEEKMHYYQKHPEKAQEIIDAAHDYIKPFLDKEREDIISVLVMQKYFDLLKY